MKKTLGMANTKVLAIIGAILVIAGIAFFATSKGGATTPMGKLEKAIADLPVEFEKTSEDFSPGFDIAKMNKKIEEDGIYSMDLNLNTDYLKAIGIDKAGVQISQKNLPKDKKTQLNLSVSVGNMLAANLDFTSIDKELYLNIPSVYEKAFKFDLSTIGADLQNDIIKEETGEDISALKDLKVDLYAVPSTAKAMKDEYFTYVKSEFEALKNNAVVETGDLDTKLADSVKGYNSSRSDLEQLNIQVKSQDVKAFLKKSIDYYEDLQSRQITGMDLSEVQAQFDDLKQQIDDEELPEVFTIKALLSKDNKLVLLAFDVEEDSNLNLFFVGEKNTTDHIVLTAVNEEDKIDVIEFKMSTGEKENEIKVNTFDDMVKISAIYGKDEKSLNMDIDTSEDMSLKLQGKYEDVKPGVGYNFVIDSLKADYAGQAIDFKGNILFSLETPTIEAPKDSVEILKVDKDELDKIMEKVEENVKNNYGFLLSMMGIL